MKFGGIVIVGIGGTGVLKASEILSRFLLYQGFDVRQSEVHGMAQRGGSVITQLKYGEKVYSPLLGKGEAQFMIATEELKHCVIVSFFLLMQLSSSIPGGLIRWALNRILIPVFQLVY